jgi:hypothetical protein
MGAKPVCLDCVVDECGEDRGLDLARKYGHVDFDVQTCEWFVPETDSLRTGPVTAARGRP